MTEIEQDKSNEHFRFGVTANFPGFLQDEGVYNEVSKTIKGGADFFYDQISKTMHGSSTFLAARLDSFIKQFGMGVASLADFGREDVMNLMAGGKFYSDAPAIVFRSVRDSYEPNNPLIRKLAQLVEERNGRLRLPVLVTGFDVVPYKEDKDYGLDIIARKDFRALQDEKLKYEYGAFSTIDENGLPNFKEDGERNWFTRDKGLSRIMLWKNFDLETNLMGDLAKSKRGGRIIIVRDSV